MGPPQEVRRTFGRCLRTLTTQEVDTGGMPSPLGGLSEGEGPDHAVCS